MFQHFSEFIDCIESIPPKYLTFEERETLLEEAKALIKQHNLAPQIPVITVTGTNGKGSTVQALSEILVHHGVNVFAFTSPHLISYTERFAYNLEFVDEETLLRLANTLATFVDFSDWNFFFILFFMSLLLCQERPLDCLILEVGLGGRLDPTNILDASLVILTQVELDHTSILGNTREEIGFQKTGLLREGIPFICGDPNPPFTVIEQAQKHHCRFYQLNQHFGFYVHENQWNVWLEGMTLCNLPAPQIHLISLSSALQAVKLLFPSLKLTKTFMENELPAVYLPGRFQRLLFGETELLIDVSHNPAAVEALAKFLQLLPEKHTIAIFGGKATKDIMSIINIMNSAIDDWWLVPVNTADGMDTEALAKFFEPPAIETHQAASVEEAMRMINKKNFTNARVVIFGSFHVAGPALAFLHKETI